MTAAWTTTVQTLNPETSMFEPVEVCSACGVLRAAIPDWNQHAVWHLQDGR